MERVPLPPCAFGPFRLDRSEHRLLRDGRVVPLTPKIFDLLCALVRQHGHVVAKEQLLREVWPDTFVDEANLNRSISVLRKALGDHRGEQRYIETVPKLGYRFVAPIAAVADSSTAPSPAPVARPPTSGRGALTWLATAAGTVMLVLAVGVPDSGVTTPAAITVEPSHRQLTFTGHDGLPSISPDGTRVAYVSSTKASQSVMIRDLGGGDPVEIINASGAGSLRWSPAGDELLFWARTPQWEGIFIAATGGEPRRIAYGSYVAAWSPDGHTIATARYLKARITFFDRAGRQQRSVQVAGEHAWMWDLDWSADQDRLLVTSEDQQGVVTIYSIRPDGQQQQVVLRDRAQIAIARWAVGSKTMVFSRRANQTVSILSLAMSGGVRRAGAEAVALLSGLEMDRSFGISADGRHLVYARAPYHSNLWLVEAGREPHVRQLTWGTSLVERPSVSPDGRSILFTSGRESRANLYSMPMTGGTAIPVTRMDAFSIGGVWSADGRQIAFVSTQDGVSRVWTVDAGGGAPRPMATRDISTSYDLAWHPSPHILVQQPGNRDYLELDAEGGAMRPLVTDRSVGWIFSPVHSPDTRRAAVAWNHRDGRGIWTIDRETGRERLVYRSGADSLTPIGWSTDGRSIYVVEAKGAIYRGIMLPLGETRRDVRILRVDADNGQARLVATLPFDEIGGVSMAPDGRRFVCTVYSSESDVWLVDLQDGRAGVRRPS